MGWLITTGPGHIRFEGWGTGVWLGNGFLDTHDHPVNTDLDLARFPFALCPPLLGISLVTEPGLAPSLLASCQLGFLFFYLAAAHVLLYGASFQARAPTYFLLGEPGFGVPVGQMLMSYWE